MPSERFLSQMKKLQVKVSEVYDRRNQGGNEALGADLLGSHL